MAKVKSVYEQSVKVEGDVTITLTAQERLMIINAMTILVPKEVDVIPMLMLSDKVIRGKSE